MSSDQGSKSAARQRRRERGEPDPLIDFDDLELDNSGPRPRLGSSGPVAGFLVSAGTILGMLAGTAGAFAGQATNWWMGPVAMAVTMAPFYGAAWLLSRNGQPKAAGAARSPVAVAVAWTAIGAGLGIALGVATPVMLGADISALEGLRVFAPAGAIVGVLVGLVRAGMLRKR